MAHHLPPELWAHIALYLENDRLSLTKCVRVCRQLQPVFERLIYRRVKVESEELQPKDGFISLARFKSLANQMRQSFVRRVEYTVVIPYNIPDYRATKLEGYSEQNALRDANNEAFQAGISSLFEFLTTWKEDAKISLALEVQGRVRMLEPETKANQNAKEWQGELRGERVTGPYRAQFPSGDASMLTEVSCVDHLIVQYSYRSQGIATGAFLQIAERCAALRRLHLDMPGQLRPDHVEYMRERREALASGLSRLPSTLQVFECVGCSEQPWSNTLPALDLRSAKGIDELSSSLRLFSCNLRELRLRLMSVDMDFLFPLDERGNPLPESSSLYWPHLETIALDGVAEYTPSGEWLFDYELESGDEEDIPDPATGDEIFESRWLREEYEISREKMNTEHFHRLFVSLGYASRRMPVLRLITFSVAGSPRTKFTFTTTSGARGVIEDCHASTLSLPSSSRPLLGFRSDSAYRPDRRVADAWGFELDEMKVVHEGPREDYHFVVCSVTLDRARLDR
ncbi:hypothetical protein BJX68DRAFT_276270 [Aspergillus pseudodeflectus]|uniref:F-box domain-containing protein n=1 Tax=Aspergillus pseudodeflectus TaxID=176178 RepID=A0ABR4K9D3_9EURO